MDLEEYEIKKKAQELVRKFLHTNLLSMSRTNFEHVKVQQDKEVVECAVECAIISVNEILELCEKEFDTSIYSPADYWHKVKIEIEKMK